MRSWTEEEARGHLARFESSELTLTDFCDQLGVSTQRMYYWRERLSPRTPAPAAAPRLMEVAVRPSAQTVAGSIVIEFPTGHVLRVPPGVGLVDVLRAVGLRAC